MRSRITARMAAADIDLASVTDVVLTGVIRHPSHYRQACIITL